MSTEPASDLKLEIGHVLFIDIVGYSKLNIHEQNEHCVQSETAADDAQRSTALSLTFGKIPTLIHQS